MSLAPAPGAELVCNSILKASVDRLRVEVDTLREENARLRKRLCRAKAKVSAVKEKLSEAREQLKASLENEKRFSLELENVSAQNSALEKQLAQREGELDRAQSISLELKEKISSAEEFRQTAALKNTLQRNTLIKLKNERERLGAELSALRNAQSSANQLQTQSSAERARPPSCRKLAPAFVLLNQKSISTTPVKTRTIDTPAAEAVLITDLAAQRQRVLQKRLAALTRLRNGFEGFQTEEAIHELVDALGRA